LDGNETLFDFSALDPVFGQTFGSVVWRTAWTPATFVPALKKPDGSRCIGGCAEHCPARRFSGLPWGVGEPQRAELNTAHLGWPQDLGPVPEARGGTLRERVR